MFRDMMPLVGMRMRTNIIKKTLNWRFTLRIYYIIYEDNFLSCFGPSFVSLFFTVSIPIQSIVYFIYVLSLPFESIQTISFSKSVQSGQCNQKSGEILFLEKAYQCSDIQDTPTVP